MPRSVALVYGIMIFASTAVGQRQGSQPNCTASAPNVPVIRSAGLTELVGDIVIQCSGITLAAGAPVSTANITVYLDAPITSSPFIPNGNAVASNVPLVLINDPAPANQVPATYNPGSYQSPDSANMTWTGTGISFPGGAAPNIFQGAVSGTEVSFYGVPLVPAAASQGTATIRITNIRANANAAAAGAVTTGTSSLISVTATSALRFQQNFAASFKNKVAIVGGSLNSTVTTGSAPICSSYNSGMLQSNPVAPTTPSAQVNISESSPGVFRGWTISPQNNPGTVYNTESGFTYYSGDPNKFPSVPGTEARIKLSFVPGSTSVFVPQTIKSGTNVMAAEPPYTVNGSTGLVKVPLTGGSGSISYLVESADPTTAVTFAVPVYFAFAGSASTTPAAPIQITTDYKNAGASPTTIPQFVSSANALQLFTENSCGGNKPLLSTDLSIATCKTILLASAIQALQDDLQKDLCATRPLGIWSDTGPVNSVSLVIQTPFGTFQIQPQARDGGPEIAPQAASTTSTPLNAMLGITPATSTTPGTYQASATISAPGAANSISLQIPIQVLDPKTPIVTQYGVTDAASYGNSSIAPGEIFSIFGTSFGPASGVTSATLDAQGKLPTTLGGVQVTFDGVAAPLLYVAGGQLAGVAPFGLAGKSSTVMQLTAGSLQSPPVTLTVNPASITVWSADGSGSGQAVAFNSDLTLNSPSNPAAAGTVVVIYVNYGGPLSPAGTDGRTTTGAPYPVPLGNTSVTIGGVPATDVKYFGNVPTLLESVMQINVTVPQSVKADSYVPVSISAAGATSPAFATIAVK